MNNDVISRSALLEAMPKNEEIFSFEVRRVICNAPAVDAEVVRHGRWDSEVVKCRDWKGRQRDYFQPHSCSLCHKPDSGQGKSNYCPNCGAKMRGNVDASE